MTVALSPSELARMPDSGLARWLGSLPEDEYAEAIDSSTRAWALATGVTIRPKQGHARIPVIPNAAQRDLEAKLEAQREAGRPGRGVALKARQVGVSTWCQLRMIHRATRRPNRHGLTVAQDTKTGNFLFGMGEGMYSSLPDEDLGSKPLKPPIRRSKYGRHLHFAQADHASWVEGRLYPNSHYTVDTAMETEAGRGGTFWDLHLSEYAMWERAKDKLASLTAAVPEEPDTTIVVESTARGHNHFRDLWLEAQEDESPFFTWFWPWWKQQEYATEFFTAGSEDRFEISEHRYGEDEPALAEMMRTEGCSEETILHKLNWRRGKIAQYGGDFAIFKQEFPATEDEAFIGSGSRVFNAERVSVLLSWCEERNEAEPPLRGQLRAGSTRSEEGRSGEVEIPESPLVVSRADLEEGVPAHWTFWLSSDDDGQPVVPRSSYILGVDVSGGEVEEGSSEPAMHAIEVIDHKTGDQVAEYASRIDPHLLTREVYLAALLFNDAYLAVERTGGWGLALLYTLWYDWHYPFLYRHRTQQKVKERSDKRLGWNTDPKTKPLIVSNGQELINTETTGIRSAVLAREMLTYIRDPEQTGLRALKPESGRFADRLMAWLIAQKVRLELPVPEDEDSESASEVISTFRPYDPVTGY